MVNLIRLQAAIGMGLFLMEIFAFLLLLIFPACAILLSIRNTRIKQKLLGRPLNTNEYIKSIGKAILYSTLYIFLFIVLIILLVIFFVDLSIS